MSNSLEDFHCNCQFADDPQYCVLHNSSFENRDDSEKTIGEKYSTLEDGSSDDVTGETCSAQSSQDRVNMSRSRSNISHISIRQLETSDNYDDEEHNSPPKFGQKRDSSPDFQLVFPDSRDPLERPDSLIWDEGSENNTNGFHPPGGPFQLASDEDGLTESQVTSATDSIPSVKSPCSGELDDFSDDSFFLESDENQTIGMIVQNMISN